jgi:WhiB family redox-sensing transcriptional regulator
MSTLFDFAFTQDSPFDGTQACAKVDPEIFFPSPADRKAIVAAKEVCSSCKFINPCLDQALWETDLDGIWGGTTPRQRQTMRTTLRRRGVRK